MIAKPISVERIKYYLAHELAGHVARAVAGERSILGLFGIGTRGHLVTEEGLSLYQERQTMQAAGHPFDDSGIWVWHPGDRFGEWRHDAATNLPLARGVL